MEFGLKWGPSDNHNHSRTNPNPQRQSWRSRKGKSSPKTSFVLTRIQFPSGVKWGDKFFHSMGVCSTKWSKIVTPSKNLKLKFPGVPLQIADHMAAIFQQKVVPRAAVVAAAIPKWLLRINSDQIRSYFKANLDSSSGRAIGSSGSGPKFRSWLSLWRFFKNHKISLFDLGCM